MKIQGSTFNKLFIAFLFTSFFKSYVESEVKDLSKKGLKKIPKTEDSQLVRILVLDDNELQKIDNIDSFLRIEKVIHITFDSTLIIDCLVF